MDSVKATLLTAIGVGGLVFVLSLERPLYGQGSKNVANSPGGPFADSLERRDRETALRSLSKRMAEKETAPPVNPKILKQINEDLTRIQTIRQGLVSDIAAGKPFEFDRLSNDASEIRKLANRLKSSLAFYDERTDSGRQPPVEFGQREIQKAAFRLCLEISRFTGNPIFKSGGAYRARDAIEAGRTLDTVINLSSNIKDSAARLRKSDR
jgi:hypothetical protein